MSILLRSGKEQAMFGGDVLRHPVQLRRPRMELGVLRVPGTGACSRHWALDQAARQGMLYFSSHFAGTAAGRIVLQGNEYGWQVA